jgi:hypothetical protein
MSTVQGFKASTVPLPREGFDRLLTASRQAAHKQKEQGAGYQPASPEAKAPALADYRAIGRPGEIAADTLSYETLAGQKVLVLRSTNPTLFAAVRRDFETLNTLNEAIAKGDRRAGPTEAAPSSVRDVERLGPEVLRAEAADGRATVVARADNPALFEVLLGYQAALEGIQASERQGYRRASDDETWPPASGIQVGPVDEVGPGLIRYDNGDGKVVVHRDDNPGLFDYLAALQGIVSDPAKRERLNQAQGDGFSLLPRESDVPAYGDIQSIVRADGLITYETFAGDKVAVSEALSPQAYARLSTYTEVMVKANAQEKEGYATLHPADYLTTQEIEGATLGPEGEVGDGFIRAEIPDGEGGMRKVVVSRELSPDLYERLVAQYEGRVHGAGQIDDARRASQLPTTGEVDVRAMRTTEQDPNDPQRILTVGELTWQRVVEGWKKGIADGSIMADDDRAKLFRALRAQGMLESGLGMVTLDISQGQGTAKTQGEDFRSIIDGRKLDQQLTGLFASDSVQQDFASAQQSALAALPNKDEAVGKLEDMAFSEGYVQHLAQLQQDGQGGLAEADMRETYAALASVDPAQAARFAQQVQMDTLMLDLDRLLADPSRLTDDNVALATQDTVKTVLTALKKAGVDLPRRTAESLDKFVEELLGDKQTAKDFGKALQQLGDLYTRNGEIKQSDIDHLMKSDVYTALNDKTHGGMLTTIAELNKNGVLGSTGGLISLASGIYQMAGGKLGGSPEERLAIAKELVSFFGASQHFVNLGTHVIDAINGTDLNRVLALDKSLPDIFGKDQAKGKAPVRAEPTWSAFAEQVRGLLEGASTDGERKLNRLLNLDDAGKDEVLKGMRGEYVKNPTIKGANLGTRSLSAFLRVLDAGANTFVGAADVALGALMIKGGLQRNDGATIAQGAVTVAAGSFGIGGGAAAFGALKGLAFARAAVGPMFWVSAALTVATLPFAIVQDIKYNKQLDDYRSGLADLFKQLDGDGVLTQDGQQRYQFLDDYLYSYAQRDSPADQSIFDYRQDEWDYFLDHGFVYLDGQHQDYQGDGDNLDTQMDGGSTIAS